MRLLLALVSCVLLVGCGDNSTAAKPTGPPKTIADCSHKASQLAGQWEDGMAFSYNDGGDLYGCVDPTHGGTLSASGSSGITVTPAHQAVTGDGIEMFKVVVAPETVGRIYLRWSHGASSGSLSGPFVVQDGSGWSFAEHS